MNTTTQSLLGTAAALVVASLIVAAGSSGSVSVGGLPLFLICAMVAFGVQWLAFVHAWTQKTEMYYDLMGSVTYISVVLIALLLNEALKARDVLLALMISIWAARLGSFLFARIRKDGFDRRFNKIKENAAQFFMTWTLQGLWVTVTASAAVAAITSTQNVPLGIWAAIGALLWLAGFVIEVVADQQKKAFREDPANRDTFITSGLWRWSRHPNYFGEILLWLGITVIAFPHLQGWQYVTLISPVFVFVLLNYISGVRMLEVRANRRWGDDPEYQAYKKRTSVLVPLPPG